ncbi:MAG: alkaline phosphatase family protein [archaeon]
MKPDYNGGSLVNLMSTISLSFNKIQKYKPLNILAPKELTKKNTILIILDGLGYNYLMQHGDGTVFEKHLKGKITSVFPSTTASAITTFITGTAPMQHAITGWFMHLKEIGAIAKILPFNLRVGGPQLTQLGILRSEIFREKKFACKIDAKSYIITSLKIKKAENIKEKNITIRGYNSINGFFEKILFASKKPGRKYIYAYWPDFDTNCHEYGVSSRETLRHFFMLAKKTELLLRKIKNSDVIITADHGLIDTPKEKCIFLNKHKKLYDCLTMPVCGDARCTYCYVRPDKVKEFTDYVENHLFFCCSLHKSEDLIKENYYGLFTPNKKLHERIGDFVLIAKDNYVLRDIIPGQKFKFLIGNHGGVSEDEMLVPLIFYSAKA